MSSNESSDLEYWTTRLRDQEPCFFPVLNDGQTGASSRSHSIEVNAPDLSLLESFSQNHTIGISTIFQTAWALVLRSYTSNDNVCFGYRGSSSGAIPCQINVPRESSLQHVLDVVDTTFARDRSHSNTTLRQIESALELGETGISNTEIYLHDEASFASACRSKCQGSNLRNGERAIQFEEDRDQDTDELCSQVMIRVEIRYASERVQIRLRYRYPNLSDGQAPNVGSALEMALTCVLEGSHRSIADQTLFSNYHASQTEKWNQQHDLKPLNLTFHGAITAQARAQPDSKAVDAWDEQWTYREMEEISSRLARHLVSLGVANGMKIPLVFEKSGWWLISMIAVLKSGGAFVPIDPSQPALRLKELLDDIRPKFLLSSTQYSNLLADLVETTVVVSRITMERNSTAANCSVDLPNVTAESEAYVMYTSGTTGKPKGASMNHGAFLSGLRIILEGTNLGPGSRVLQNASYAWTPCIVESIGCLWNGGCLCIPSESSKQNELTQVFNDMHITWALLSPSITKTIKRESVDLLESLLLAGEPASQEIISRWASENTNVWVFHAATEVAIISRSDKMTEHSNVQNLGQCKAICRISEVGNPEKQVPIGSVGEIVLQAPWIANGYLNDPERTADKFLDRPKWLNGGNDSRWYRVGDLARQNSDGTLVLAGRGDSMVKIRGQRFDMSEVEKELDANLSVRNSLPIMVKEGLCKHRLVAVVALHEFATDGHQSSTLALLNEPEMQKAVSWVSDFQQSMALRFPSFMIPSVYVMVRYLPLTITGKVDRVSLSRLIAKMDLDTFENVSSLGIIPEAPETEVEERLQQIWSDVLRVPRERVGRNQSFISLGGDSILAMLVGGRCNDVSLGLKTQDILKYGTIAELAQHTAVQAKGNENTSLQHKNRLLHESIIEKLHQVGVPTSYDVEDAYPTSPMQQGMLLSKARLKADYNTSTVYEVVPKTPDFGLSVERLMDAWQQVVNRYSTLRTFFVESTSQSGSFDQVVLRNWDVKSSTSIFRNMPVESRDDIIQVFNHHPPHPYISNQPPHNFTIIQDSCGRLFCRLNIEHTIIDGMSVEIIVRDIILAYDGYLKSLELLPYSKHIDALQQVDCADGERYWKSYLDGMHPCILPSLAHSLSRELLKTGYGTVSVNIKSPVHLLRFCQSQELTVSALFRTVWGSILRVFTGLDEVAFGYTTSGRNSSLPGITESVGTFLNMLVCRIDFKESNTVKEVISKAQKDYQNSLPYQHTSQAQIQHMLGLNGQQLFNTAMTVLKQVTLSSGDKTSIDLENFYEWIPTEYDINVQCWVSNSTVKVDLWYRAEYVSAEHAQNIASTFGKALESITDDLDQWIAQLDMFSEEHKKQIWNWNSRRPEVLDSCLHHLISTQAVARPDELAIISWECEMTFQELENKSNQLAHRLVSLGVVPEAHVLLCFEKSAVAIVSMLAVLKAGGVCVSIDSSHPIQRLQRIINDTAPICCLISNSKRALFDKEGLSGRLKHVVSVDQSSFDLAETNSTRPCVNVRPNNAAFVLFTSGSTGNPKGIVHTHSTIASSISPHADAMRIGLDSRTLQFSAFVFDVSLTEIFMSLARGGVLCIPSEEERMNNLEHAINRMSATWAHLTPTVASLLDPSKVPTLKHLVLAGEPLLKNNVTDWASRLELINLYGPAEYALGSTLRVGLVDGDRTDNIGRAVGISVWLVDPSNANRLVPIGGVGELLLEGPNAAREYLKDKERTLASFIENPAWLKDEKTTPPRRFYRSGDLGRYNGDGSIQLLGRIDTQVKLHGQRVELGEIEHQVKVNLSSHRLVNMAVVYVKSAKHPGGGLLVSVFFKALKVTAGRLLTLRVKATFLEFEEKSNKYDENLLMLTISQALRKILVKLDTHLADNLPSYMVPSIYCPMNAMPLLTAGKIDRRKLSQIVQGLDTAQIRLYSLAEFQQAKAMPRTRMERILQKLFAKSLAIEERSIGVDDNFFRLGADSVVAMRLAAAGREHGITIPVADIFQTPKLSEMAKVAKPFNERLMHELERSYAIQRQAIQEIYPATPLQEGLLSSMRPEIYITQHVLSLKPNTSARKLQEAWESVVEKYPILRTRIVPVDRSVGPLQIVLNESLHWQSAGALETYLKQDKKLSMNYGEPLSRHALLEDQERGHRHLVWTAHQSILDDFSISSILAELATTYESIVMGTKKPSLPNTTSFRDFSEGIFHVDIPGAESFWRSQFSELSFSPYPKIPAGHQALATDSLDYTISLANFDTSEVSLSIIIRAAWALLQAQYTDTPETVVFGMTLDGRGESACMPGINDLVAPIFATVPLKVSVDKQATIGSFLSGLQDQAEEMRQWQNFGLQHIKDLGPDAAQACDFQTLLAIHPRNTLKNSVESTFEISSAGDDAPSAYLLMLECQVAENTVDIKAQFDPQIISASQMQRMLHQLEHVFAQLVQRESSTKQLNGIEYCSREDLEDIALWNSNLPSLLEECVHEVISSHASERPENPAVSSWDNLTYRELDVLSSNLAHHLVAHFDVGPETLVPLCFDRSAWVVVAMIAVLKAGGGCVPMDPSHPASRLQEIVDATKASLILCSPRHESLSRSLAERYFCVSRKTADVWTPIRRQACSNVKPDNTCYVIFTSGSTGTPKGVIVTHSAFSTAATIHGVRLNLNHESRVLHFSSYAFDVSVLEILTTLFNGGCVCVPLESERLGEAAKTIREHRVNWAALTPSFIRTISPDQVPDLKTLVLGGEPLGADNIDVWCDHVHLMNGYGLCETVIGAILNANIRRGFTTPDMIGTANGGACWIVDPENHGKLAPLGAVGELLIEGAALARGYLDDPEKTSKAFIENSHLLMSLRKAMNGKDASGSSTTITNGHCSNEYNSNGPRWSKSPMGEIRMYKTGDLVRYDTSGLAEGTIRFVGRKDTQVKVRGQRVELGDIEYHLKSNLKGVQHVSVEQITLPGRETRYLAAFFSLEQQTQQPGSESQKLTLPMSVSLKQSIFAAEAALMTKLPTYMIPALYIPMVRIPLLVSGKTNRRQLKQVAEHFSEEEIDQYSLTEGEKRTPKTRAEKILVDVWIQILHLGAQAVVGLDDNFFRLGGDSIRAMHLMTLARENGLSLTVAKIFRHPSLEEMATATVELSAAADDELEPFSLLSRVEDVDITLHKLYRRYQIPHGSIEDAFPTSALQEGLFLLSIKQPGSYMSQITLSLRSGIDIDHFKSAWQKTAERNSMLRTRIAHIGTRTVQFIVKEQIDWRHGSNLDEYLIQDKNKQMDHGSPLVRYAIISSDSERYFVLTSHHSLYDGWSMMLIMEDFNKIYKSGPTKPPAPPYANFIKYLMNADMEAAKSFWLSQFSGKSLASFPEPRTAAQAPKETHISQFTDLKRPSGSDITLSTVIRAAWALVTARYADTEDVFFGAISTGRNASLPYIEQMTGPLIATIPVCISIDGTETVQQFLQRIQSQATDIIPFEHTGLQTIKSFGAEAETVCNFQNLLVIQPEGSEDIQSDVWKEKVLFAKGEMVTLTYALIVECRLYKDKVRLGAQYRENVTPTRQMQRMLDQFEHVLHQLNNVNSASQLVVNDIEIISEKDKVEILDWSKDSQYPAVDDCVHHIIERQAIQTPTSPAVESWDATFTYKVLNDMASKLAQHLKTLGVGTDVFVPLCFDKSAWTVVAILAVLKAGGAYLSLDPKHPKSRKDLIIRDVSATVILTSSQYRDDFKIPGVTVLNIDQSMINSLQSLSKVECCPGKSSDAAFVVFTSGSTGVPKGIVMEHGPFVTSAKEHAKALLINSDSRVLQFAAYTYDVSMGEILTTLMQGGCICVPSEEQRMANLPAAINHLKVNWTFLTPTVAGFLKPSEVPSLKVLVLGGEHATNQNIETWSEHVNLINSYGPAETAIWCCRAPNVSPGANPASLGQPVGAALWITDATNPDSLTPVGCVGELLIEGHTLAREYLNDPKKTAAAFITNPKWATNSGKARRFYRTGDLVRYGPNGDILFVGRRDTQAKIHGQRIELGEIEHNLVKCCPSDWFPVVDILRFTDGSRDATLAAFIHMKNFKAPQESSDIFISMDSTIVEDLGRMRSQLEQVLPRHMVPTTWIPVSRVPLTAGGKVDRRALKDIGQSLTNNRMLPYLLSGQESSKPPTTEMQKRLQMLWSKVLGVDAEMIGIDTSFLRIGGDSVAAMRLSSLAGEDGLLLTIRSIFTSPKLLDMAETVERILPRSEDLGTYEPFSTLTVLNVPDFIDHVLRPQLAGELGEIEDVLEATDYQRWTQGCGQLRTRGYNNYFIFNFKGTLDVGRLHTACKKLLEHHPVLRTIFIPHKDKLFQVVMKSIDPEFATFKVNEIQEAQQSIIEQDMERPVRFGDSIIRFLLLKEGRENYRLLMRISHSLYDGISLPTIIKDLKASYAGEPFSNSSPYHRFISGLLQTTNIAEAESYWRTLLEGSTMTSIINHNSPSYRHPINKSLKRTVAAPETNNTGITFASIVKTAWSLVLAKFSATTDVTFGQITTGRSAPIPGIDEIIGPCMNIVPVRIKLSSSSTLASLLEQVQSQHLDMLPYENLGFQHIIEKCTTWPKHTRFSSVVQHTNFNIGMEELDTWSNGHGNGDLEMEMTAFAPEHDEADVWIWTGPTAGDRKKFYVDFTYASTTLSEGIANEMLDELCGNIARLCESPGDILESHLGESEARDPLPLPLPELSSRSEEGLQPSDESLAIVRETWAGLFGDDKGVLSDGMTDDTPFFNLRGDLLAAAQIAWDLEKRGLCSSVEDVVDNPTIHAQAAFIERVR